MNRIKDLPWVALRDAGYVFRRLVATKNRPDREHLLIDAPIEELQTMFRKEHFRSGWMLSYHYKGEDANLSRAEYKHGDYNELQLHIRLFDREDDRTELMAHVEVCPIEHPRQHLKGKYHSEEKGVMMTKGILDSKNIVYETVNPDNEE